MATYFVTREICIYSERFYCIRPLNRILQSHKFVKFLTYKMSTSKRKREVKDKPLKETVAKKIKEKTNNKTSDKAYFTYKPPIEYSVCKIGEDFNFKISSWNINGIRAWLKKDQMSYSKKEMADIFCFQEIKCAKKDIPPSLAFKEYTKYWNSADRPGYAGTGIISKKKALNVNYGMGLEKHDSEGRVITLEYDDFYLVNAYVPNSGRGLPKLEYRTTEWDVDFRKYLKKLDSTKPVILCGDLNVAHKEIGFVDVFRHFYPDTLKAYTFWSYMGNARNNDVGWRLDYFVVSERFLSKICDCVIRKNVMGSDHCPLTLFLKL